MIAPPGKPATFASEWEEYAQIIPPHAPAVQRVESRRAFYAGAICLLGYVMTRLSPGKDPTADDLEFMARLDAELQAFVAETAAEAAQKRGT